VPGAAAALERAHRARSVRAWTSLPLLGLLLILTLLIAARFGAVFIPLDHLVGMLRRQALGGPAGWPASEEAIFFQLRLPRVLAAALVGAALSTAGVLFQGLLRNPLADPYILGTSGGAGLGAAAGAILVSHFTILGFGPVAALAFVGAIAATFAVYGLARVGARTPATSLVLAGVMVSSILVYLLALLLVLDDRLQINLPYLYSWLLGGIAVTGWRQLLVIVPVVSLALLLAQRLTPRLNVLALGEELAQSLGIALERTKAEGIAVAALLTAAAVSISGLVGFVGLVVPHAVRLVLGGDHRLLLPASALAGATFLCAADLVARLVLAPTEIPLGIVTALAGGPFFLYLLRRAGQEYRM
jgi:iron complex transport system permease protein